MQSYLYAKVCYIVKQQVNAELYRFISLYVTLAYVVCHTLYLYFLSLLTKLISGVMVKYGILIKTLALTFISLILVLTFNYYINYGLSIDLSKVTLFF